MDSKYVSEVLAVLWFSETILSFLINVIFEPPWKCLFEKYCLQVFQNSLVAVLTLNLSKYYFLHSIFILTTNLLCFLYLKISTTLREFQPPSLHDGTA